MIRPDSGPPVETVLRVLDRLGRSFGTKLNSGEVTALVAYVRTLAKPKG